MDASYVYLDNAATSWPKPPEVGAAMVRFLEHSAGNPGRGGHRLARQAAEHVEGARRRLAKIVNAERPERMVLTPGCTDALNLAIHGVLMPFRHGAPAARPHAVMSSVEHNAVARTLHAYERDGVIDLTVVPCDGEASVAADGVLGACTDRTVLVCLSHASNATGTIQPVHEVGRGLRARAPAALFLVDAAQTAGHVPLDVRQDRIDLLSIAGHKGLLGPTGTGALYVGPRAYSDDPAGARLQCPRTGGTGARAPGLDMPTELPDALEAGTSNAVGYAGLAAAIDAHPPGRSLAHEMALTGRLLEGLRGIGGVRVIGRSGVEGRTAVVMFTVAGYDPRDFAAILDGTFGIAVRAGMHCAPMLHQTIGTAPAGALRASPGWASTEAHVAALLDAVREIAGAPVGRA